MLYNTEADVWKGAHWTRLIDEGLRDQGFVVLKKSKQGLKPSLRVNKEASYRVLLLALNICTLLLKLSLGYRQRDGAT